jgi:hypothetical protein
MTTEQSENSLRQPESRSQLLLVGLCLCVSACSSGPREDVEPLFRTLETGSVVEAMAAGEKLAALYEDDDLPRLEKALDAAPVRTLTLIGELTTDGSAKLLLDRLSYLLESKDRETARMAAVTAGLRRLKGATGTLLHHPEEAAVVRALGRIWAQTLDAPVLPRAEEIDRLTVLAVTHRQAMGVGGTLEACEAMLSVMIESELADFLAKHSADRFLARHLCDDAVRRPGFDAEKGLRVHEALLASPDVGLVAGILANSPFPLRTELVRGFLKDPRTTANGVKLTDVAEKRLNR